MADVFTNLAGTMSDTFVIGKRGVKLHQGVGAPTGILAPVGSLYFRKDNNGGFYQMSANNTWVRLLVETDVTYIADFTSANLTDGVLTVTHNLNAEYPHVSVWNDSKQVVSPSLITSVNSSSVTIDLTGMTVSGTWRVRVSL